MFIGRRHGLPALLSICIGIASPACSSGTSEPQTPGAAIAEKSDDGGVAVGVGRADSGGSIGADAGAFGPLFYEFEPSGSLSTHRLLSSGEGALNPNGKKWMLDLALYPARFRVRYQEYNRVSATQVANVVTKVVDGSWSVDAKGRLVLGDIGLAVAGQTNGSPSLLLGIKRALISSDIVGVATDLHIIHATSGPDDWH